MTVELPEQDMATRPAFGADVRTPAPSAVPVLGDRPPGLLVRIAKLLAGRGRRKPKAAAEAALGVPD
ncbi:MAG TPA: hypothetical protein DEA50_11015, partial [Parvularcula sp.]|nr:hypothetical protein [Parvularcula sp.]